MCSELVLFLAMCFFGSRYEPGALFSMNLSFPNMDCQQFKLFFRLGRGRRRLP